MFEDEDRYYDGKLAELEEKATVPFSDYIDLEEKYDMLKSIIEEVKETIKNHPKIGDWKYLSELVNDENI